MRTLLLSIPFIIQLVWATLPSGVIFPLFIDPQEDCSGWLSVTDSVKLESLIEFYIVVNPSHGPGKPNTQPSQKYQTCIAQLAAAGTPNNNLILLGYVDTALGYGVALSKIFSDIDTYSGWNNAYRPGGIYLDNASNDDGSAGLYQSISNRIREDFGNTSLVVLNPSTTPSPAYFAFSDIIITINEPFANWSLSQIQNTSSTPAHKQAVVLYDNETGKTGDFGLFDNIVDQISAIADVKASFITNVSQKELEFSVVPSDFSDFCGALIGSQTA